MSRKYAGMNPKSHQNLEVVWKKSQQRKWKKKKNTFAFPLEKSWENMMPQKLRKESFKKERIFNCAKYLLKITMRDPSIYWTWQQGGHW